MVSNEIFHGENFGLHGDLNPRRLTSGVNGSMFAKGHEFESPWRARFFTWKTSLILKTNFIVLNAFDILYLMCSQM